MTLYIECNFSFSPIKLKIWLIDWLWMLIVSKRTLDSDGQIVNSAVTRWHSSSKGPMPIAGLKNWRAQATRPLHAPVPPPVLPGRSGHFRLAPLIRSVSHWVVGGSYSYVACGWITKIASLCVSWSQACNGSAKFEGLSTKIENSKVQQQYHSYTVV